MDGLSHFLVVHKGTQGVGVLLIGKRQRLFTGCRLNLLKRGIAILVDQVGYNGDIGVVACGRYDRQAVYQSGKTVAQPLNLAAEFLTDHAAYQVNIFGGGFQIQILCIPNFGASEGIYLDISLACRDKDGKRYFQNFATGKTLGETADDYYRMFRIAAECSLMLNGRGNTYEQKKVDIVLTEQEAEAVGTVVDMELCGHHPPEAEAILNSALEKIDRIAFAKVQTITCHGKDDYSLWSAEIPKDMLHSILHEACERVGTLDELMDAMNPKDGYEMRLFIQTPGRQFAFYRIPERLSNLEDYANGAVR